MGNTAQLPKDIGKHIRPCGDLFWASGNYPRAIYAALIAGYYPLF